MKIDILIDSNEFWKSLKTDILLSKDYIYIQTLSFEGDSIGKLLVHSLLSSNSNDRRIAIDYWTKYVLSQKFLYTPRNFLNSGLRQEALDTTQLITTLTNNRVQVKFVNPYGPLFLKLARRNHKKLIVIDNRIVYIGGINFSEHNFCWHDMMLRIESSDIAKFIKEDFLATWNGENLNISKYFGDIHFHIFDGYSNEVAFNKIFKLMETAKERIFIESAYITFPFYEKLREIKRKGVSVVIIAPESNNRKIFDGYTRWESLRSGFDLRLYQGRMTHLKLMLIDDSYLIIGSANFDYLSYRSQQEIIAVITDSEVISNVKDKVIKEDLQNSIRFEGEISNITGYMSAVTLKSLLRLSVFLGDCC